MNKQKLIKKITSKKEFSQLPKKDVEMAFSHFDSDEFVEEEKIKLTRNLLKKVFGAFSGRRLFSRKLKEVSWVLAHHVSTKERVSYYSEIYLKLLNNFKGKINVFDLGCGVNGFSYNYFGNKKVNYIGIEAIGQLVDLTNRYFEKEKIPGKIFHFSLFELDKIKKLISMQKGKKIVFLFKIIDSLELIERDYSKKLLKEIVPLIDRIVVSFATRSLAKKEKFWADKKWLIKFIDNEFDILDTFELGSEKYIVFKNKS